MRTELAPIMRSVNVSVPPERAFQVFTQEMGTWWPFEGHSIFEDRADTIVFEGQVGGRVYEVSAQGEEGHWAEVVEFDPPRRFVLSWKPNPERSAPTIVEITFSASAAGTEVQVVHSGWEHLGEDVATVRASYDSGWPIVLSRFEQHCG